MKMSLKCVDFGNMEPIPSEYTCDGDDISPPLEWEQVPEDAQSLVLICHDPDAPVGDWVHWVCYDMVPEKSGLTEAVPKTDSIPSGGKQGINDFRKVGYGGPCPPSGTHRYYFILYALDCMLQLPAGKSRKEVEAAMQGHVIAQAELVGTYSRK